MNKRPFGPIVVLAAVLALGACGGDGDEEIPPPTSVVPASASQSVDGWINYLKSLIASAADTLEPVDTSTVTPPSSETAEPSVVD